MAEGIDVNRQRAEELWAKAKEYLADTLSPDIFDRWIGVIRAEDGAEGGIVLTIPNGFYKEWLEEHYLAMIRQALEAAGHGEGELRLEVDGSRRIALEEPIAGPATAGIDPAAAAGKRGGKAKAARCVNIGSPLNPRHTFEAFVVGSSNSFAHAAAQAVVEAPGRAYNPLFIHGGTGLGKTHLIQAMGNAVLKQGKGCVCYLSSETFTNEYIQALQQHELGAFRKKYRNVDLLLIDDIHFLAGKEGIQEEFFHTFNDLYGKGKQIVLTSDRPVSEIANLHERLVTRFEWGLVTEMEMADLETRVAILRSKREQLGLKLDDDSLFFVAEHIHSNIRKLEGSLLRVASYASLTHKPLNAENLEYLLRDAIEQENQSALTVETIQRIVAEHYDLRIGDMTSKQRPKNIAVPRQIAMYLCREMTGQSLPAIGNAFGRDHATVLHAYRKIGEQMKTDSALRQTILSLQQRLGSPNAIR